MSIFSLVNESQKTYRDWGQYQLPQSLLDTRESIGTGRGGSKLQLLWKMPTALSKVRVNHD